MTRSLRILAVALISVWAAGISRAADTNFIIFFDYESVALVSAGKDVAKDAANAFKGKATARIVIVGHTDAAEAESAPPTLSKRRADVIAAELSRLGVPASAIVAEGRGAREPLAPTAAGAREPMNRRATITVKER